MAKTALLLLCLMTAIANHDLAQDRSQARSRVVTRYGIVAAENPIAAQVGTSILADGGNAVDAAIATNAMMGLEVRGDYSPAMGGRTGGAEGLFDGSQLWRVRSPQRRGRGPRANTVTDKKQRVGSRE
jgi:gamma-glutamyltranspeptidase